MVAPRRQITIELDASLHDAVRRRAATLGTTEADFVLRTVTEAVETEGSHPHGPLPGESAYDMAVRLGIFGAAKGLPPDLATNPKYMEGFGE